MIRHDHQPKGTKGAKKVYAFVDNLVAVSVRHMRAAFPDLPAEQLNALATDIAHDMCFLYARTELHIPVALPLKLGPRNEQIYRDYGRDGPTARRYTADRIDELAERETLTPRQVRNIIASGRAAEAAAAAADFASRQGALIGFEADEQQG